MTQLIDLGKLRFYFAGSYNSSVEYELNDVVKYGGNVYTYVHALATTGNLPTNTTYWSVMVEGINFLGTYSSGTAYKPGDAVSHGANLYLNENPSTGNTPPNATYWSLIASGIQYNGVFSTSVQYQKDDVVSFGGSVYIALQDTITNAPSSSGATAYWTKLVDGTYPDQSGNNNKILKTDGTSVSWTNAPTLDDATIVDDLIVGGTTYAGDDADNFDVSAALTGARAVFDMNVSPYGQVAVHNSNTTSSTDIIAYSANGIDASGWIDMGITGEDFNQATYGITGPNDGYIFMQAPAKFTESVTNKVLTNNVATLTVGANEFRVGMPVVITGVDATFNGTYTVTAVTGTTFSYAKTATNVASTAVSPAGTAVAGKTGAGNLVLATGSNGTENKIVFAAGGLESTNEQMSITPDVNVHIEIPTASTSSTTGALTVVGGVGIAGSVNIAGNTTITGNLTFGGGSTTTSNLAVSDPLIFVGNAATGDTNDLGIIQEYRTGGATKYSGVTRDATDGVTKFFSGASTKPVSTVNFSEAGLVYSSIKTGAVDAAAITGSGNLAIATDKLTVNASTGAVAMAGALGVSGLLTANGGITSSGALTFSGGASFSGTTDVQELREQVVDVTLSTNAGTLDWTAGNIYYVATAPTGNMTFNVTNVPTDNSKIMTINVFVTQGSTGYIPGTFQIGGTSQTIRWAGGSAPTATSSAGKIDVFSFTMQRTSAGAWLVYATSSLNF
jgi:hypothetical protein